MGSVYHSGWNVDPHVEPTVGRAMKTVQITLDEDLSQDVDRAVAKLGTTRSGFTREALRRALTRMEIEALEKRHREGYERHPVEEGEFDVWEDEQVWGD